MVSSYKGNRADAYNNTEGCLTGYNCPKCKNRGYFLQEVDGELKSIDCECMKIRRSVWAIEKSGLKDQISKMTFDNYIAVEDWQKICLEKAKLFEKGWAYFGGQSGAGKTHLCTAIVGKLIRQGIQTKYMLWRDDSTKLKANVNEPEYESLIGEYKKAELLYIDDFFKTQKDKPVTQADINLAFEIINYRDNNPQSITIISSELMTEQLIEIDEATAGRIIKRSKGFIFDIKRDRARNYRLKGDGII